MNMKKKIAMFIAAMMVSLASHAQFEAGKTYVGASLSSFDLSYSGLAGGNLGLQGKAGYMLADNWMITGQLSYENKKDVPYALSLGAGARCYIVQNGLYLGASALYKHVSNYNDLMPGIQIGYAFFVNRTVTIEPEIYYEQSLKGHKDYSQVGLRIGIGIYLFKDTFDTWK